MTLMEFWTEVAAVTIGIVLGGLLLAIAAVVVAIMAEGGPLRPPPDDHRWPVDDEADETDLPAFLDENRADTRAVPVRSDQQGILQPALPAGIDQLHPQPRAAEPADVNRDFPSRTYATDKTVSIEEISDGELDALMQTNASRQGIRPSPAILGEMGSVLALAVLREIVDLYRAQSDPIADSDLDGEQPRSVHATLGLWRRASQALNYPLIAEAVEAIDKAATDAMLYGQGAVRVTAAPINGEDVDEDQALAALKFYADPANYLIAPEQNPGSTVMFGCAVREDAGAKARAVLALAVEPFVPPAPPAEGERLVPRDAE